MQIGDDCIGTLADGMSLVNQIIDLLRHTLTTHLQGTKKYTGPGWRGSLG